MSTTPKVEELVREPGFIRYLIICLVALAAIFVILAQHNYELWSFLPVLAGTLGGMTRFGPALVALAVCMLLNAPPHGNVPFLRNEYVNMADLTFCAAILAYVMAHCRLQSMLVLVFPPDPRRRQAALDPPAPGEVRRQPPILRQRRSMRVVSAHEIGLLLLALPSWAFLAQVALQHLAEVSLRFKEAWLRLEQVELGGQRLSGPRLELWFPIVLVWTFGIGLYLAAAIISYVRWRQLTSPEAALFLQDTLWQETRREQRRIHRWFVWDWIRRHRA
jgi:hypothetical protein